MFPGVVTLRKIGLIGGMSWESSAEYYRLAESRYQTGIDSSLTLLDAQRTLFSAQQAVVVDQVAFSQVQARATFQDNAVIA